MLDVELMLFLELIIQGFLGHSVLWRQNYIAINVISSFVDCILLKVDPRGDKPQLFVVVYGHLTKYQRHIIFGMTLSASNKHLIILIVLWVISTLSYMNMRKGRNSR